MSSLENYNKAPETETPDGSSVALKAVGQFHITLGWILGLIFILGGSWAIAADPYDNWQFGIVLYVISIIPIVRGYIKGARAKATAVAAINAKKTAERTERLEQMLVNMVSQGNVNETTKCPKCENLVSANMKFCPECGSQIK